ncbi:DUF1289 domain-containing protein [Aliiglaciecola lipolytica]|uniref:Fe-S protein-like proteinEB3 n=1 Tax=Aliiglaciecola lipolytica E3 TaxID=1127673 RepID=K6XNB3_9ALTE|nr:DUF1289 domain-containing protein [Aliiglaciecola lipolytica]GAC13181.1 Fe-S protein-like proteinEB3 [Aliiglaciecola lipolytica E3]
MDQLEFFDIPSPCIGVCQSGKNGYCSGCFRSREERLYWHQTSAYAKRVIIKACQRRKAISQRKNNSDSGQTIAKQTDLFDN